MEFQKIKHFLLCFDFIFSSFINKRISLNDNVRSPPIAITVDVYSLHRINSSVF